MSAIENDGSGPQSALITDALVAYRLSCLVDLSPLSSAECVPASQRSSSSSSRSQQREGVTDVLVVAVITDVLPVFLPLSHIFDAYIYTFPILIPAARPGIPLPPPSARASALLGIETPKTVGAAAAADSR